MISDRARRHSCFQPFQQRHSRGEEILAAADAFLEKRGSGGYGRGLLVLTPTRIVFFRKGVFGETVESMPIEKVTSVETRSILAFRKMIIHTSHDAMTLNVYEDRASFDAVRTAIETSRDKSRVAPASAVPAPSAAPDHRARLAALQALLDDGLIGLDEYHAKRTAIIADL